MRFNKKALSAAITLSLVLGAYGAAGATDPSLYGAESGDNPDPANITVNKKYVSTGSNRTTTGADYTVKGGTWYYIYGGYSSGSDTVSSNTVNISDSASIRGHVYGGLSYYGTAGGDNKEEGNTVNIIDGASITGAVFGGYVYSGSGAASGNTVTIEGGTIDTYESGGKTYGGNVFGGYAGGSGALSSNTVTISGGSVGGDVYGGWAYYGDATNNTVNISDGTVTGSVIGAQSYKGKATYNKVHIVNGTVEDYINGGCGEVDVSNNTVLIEGGTIAKYAIGGFSYNGTASNNTVTVSNGTINGDSADGYFNATIGIIGGYVNSGSGAASSNTVTIEGGTIGGDVYGGDAEGDGAASNNTVKISGGEITGAVVGGYSGSGAVKNNTVTVSGSADLTNAALYGYNTSGTHSDNTLTIDKNWTGGNNTVKSIQNFDTVTNNGTLILAEKSTNIGELKSTGTLGFKAVGNAAQSANISGTLNFYIPATAVNKNDVAMLAVTNALDMNGVTNIGSSVVNGVTLKVNDKVNLISDNNGITGYGTDNKGTGITVSKVASGNYQYYDGSVALDGTTKLVLTINSGLKNGENAKSPVETQAAGMAMLGMGGDVLAGVGMESAGAAAKAAKADNLGATNVMTPFAVIGGNNTRINSGSHVDLKSWNMNVGFAKEVKNNSGKLLFGPLVEYGNGSYDSYLDNGYHGDGRTNFVGVGFIAKQTNNDDTYYEGSLRAGRLANEYKSKGGNYDESTMYYGLHAGLGKVYQLNAANNIDLFLKAFWVHQNSMDTTLASKDLDMDAVDSFRSKLGFRYNHSFNAKNAMYAGLAWQYEFCGEAEATFDHMAVAENPSLKGHTGIMELGWKNNAAKNLELDLGINAYTGVQRGAGANIKLNWKF